MNVLKVSKYRHYIYHFDSFDFSTKLKKIAEGTIISKW
jgi:hypothetical protein